MYCRNCSNEVHDKAIACPKCGVNPRSEKKFCLSCAAETNANQVACTSCGIALASPQFSFDAVSLPKVDFNVFLKSKTILFASIALIGCFLPWIKINAFIMVQNLNFFNLSKVVDVVPSSILVSFLLYLFPLSLVGIIASEFVPQIAKYKKIFSLASVVLVVYVVIGLYLAANPSTPEMPAGNNDMFGGMMEKATQAAKDMISAGFGLYVSVVATIASFVFSKKES